MFLTHLYLEADPQPDMWVIAKPLVWDDSVFGLITVPHGFRTDLASIPRFLRWIPFLDPNGISRRPAAVHDWLYALHHNKPKCDHFLHESLIWEGASDWAAKIYYLGVHRFGRHAWNIDKDRIFTPADFNTRQAYDSWRRSLYDYKERSAYHNHTGRSPSGEPRHF